MILEWATDYPTGEPPRTDDPDHQAWITTHPGTQPGNSENDGLMFIRFLCDEPEPITPR